jgi:hypothetical protein
MALAQLQEAFPRFTEHSPIHGRGEQFRLDLKAGNVCLICHLNDFGWSLRLMNRGIVQPNSAHDPAEVDVLVCQKDTLEDAISALRQATAEQRRCLDLAGSDRALTLKLQDKRTRHAIADAVAQHLLELGMDVPGIDGVIINCRGGLTDD